MVNNSESWRIKDLNPEKELSEIFPFSRRASSLIVRNKKHKLLRNNFLSVSGAVDLMLGMEYHYDNFIEIVEKLSNGQNKYRKNLEHEVVAYINRMGQYYYFAKSDLVKNIIPEVDKIIPKINELIIFRHKHTAHRSVDSKQGESKHLQSVHSLSLAGKIGIIFTPKNKDKGLPQPNLNGHNNFEKLRKNHWSQGYVGYQIQDKSKKVFNIFLERDHPIIINESYNILRTLLGK